MDNKIAYYLGFLAADGWISKNALGFALKRSDRESVEYMAQITSEITGKDIKVVDYESRCGDKYYSASRFVVTDRELVGWLAKFGIIQAKSYKDNNFIENIPDENKLAFVAGYFDGDGGLSKVRVHNTSLNTIALTITGRKIPLECITNSTGFNWKLYCVNDTETYVARLYAHADIVKFGKMYISLSNEINLLKRKKKMFLEAINDLENRTRTKVTDTKNSKSCIQAHIECPICGENMRYGSTMCINCYHEHMRRHMPPIEVLQELIKIETYESIGRQYNVSGKAVRKWFDSYGIHEERQAKHNIIDKSVLKIFLTNLSIKETSIELNVPDWKIRDILGKVTNNKYKELLFTGQPVINSDGVAYISATNACKSLGYENNSHHIMACVKGNRRSALGFEWYGISFEEYLQWLKTTTCITRDVEVYRELESILQGM